MQQNRVHRLLARQNLSRLQAVSQSALAHRANLKTLGDAALQAHFSELQAFDPANLASALGVASEAARRTLDLEPYEVQLQGAAALFQGVIVEMKTGEGKTLTVALAAAIAATKREGVHVVTVNPYLAQRDAQAMQPLFEFLGLTVGVTLPGQTVAQKQAAYACDITYGVHSEFGFDYLRDHLVASLEDRVQRGQVFAIVDEADSVLIDEARTPLIISQPAHLDGGHYRIADTVVRTLQPQVDYAVDEQAHQALLTEEGLDKVEALLMGQKVIAHKKALYEPANLHLLRHLSAALRAHAILRRDKDYIVDNGEVKIVDSATGRILEGRQWQEGLHQALEVKEGLEIRPENETAAEITYQSLFGRYSRLSGLTGTALTSLEEFESTYHLTVVPIPTHRPVVRQDLPDLLFRSRDDKFKAIAADIAARTVKGQPVLVGTASVQESEALSTVLSRAAIPHRVLNARQNQQEAQIIADAGRPGAVTLATNMAGRGTDIVLGGHTEKDDDWRARHARVLAAGGLHVIGTTRNESRRVDDQLRGRAGRQGDAGSSQFYLCLEDDLLRVFGGDRLGRLLTFAGVTNEALSGAALDRAVSTAQRRVEGQHFEARRNLAKFDGAMSEQREAVYSLRRAILAGELERDYCVGLVEEAAQTLVDAYVDHRNLPETWKVKELKQALEQELGPTLPVIKWALVEELEASHILSRVQAQCAAYYCEKREPGGQLSQREQLVLVAVLDQLWRAHLTHLDGLREGMHLRGYAQQDPAMVFRKEAYDAFLSFRRSFATVAASALTSAFRASLVQGAVVDVPAPDVGTEPASVSTQDPSSNNPYRDTPRNALCPCGSNLRYKHCHGKLA